MEGNHPFTYYSIAHQDGRITGKPRATTFMETERLWNAESLNRHTFKFTYGSSLQWRLMLSWKQTDYQDWTRKHGWLFNWLQFDECLKNSKYSHEQDSYYKRCGFQLQRRPESSRTRYATSSTERVITVASEMRYSDRIGREANLACPRIIYSGN